MYYFSSPWNLPVFHLKNREPSDLFVLYIWNEWNVNWDFPHSKRKYFEGVFCALSNFPLGGGKNNFPSEDFLYFFHRSSHLWHLAQHGSRSTQWVLGQLFLNNERLSCAMGLIYAPYLLRKPIRWAALFCKGFDCSADRHPMREGGKAELRFTSL